MCLDFIGDFFSILFSRGMPEDIKRKYYLSMASSYGSVTEDSFAVSTSNTLYSWTVAAEQVLQQSADAATVPPTSGKGGVILIDEAIATPQQEDIRKTVEAHLKLEDTPSQPGDIPGATVFKHVVSVGTFYSGSTIYHSKYDLLFFEKSLCIDVPLVSSKILKEIALAVGDACKSFYLFVYDRNGDRSFFLQVAEDWELAKAREAKKSSV